MAAKNKAASVGAGAVAAGKAAKENPYVQRLVEDEDLRENLKTAYESARGAYTRMANGKGPSAALNDKKTQKQLREAAASLKEAADALRDAKKARRRRLRVAGVADEADHLASVDVGAVVGSRGEI